MIGAWPVLMGLSMYLQKSLNPPPTDPIQRMVMDTMPIMMTIILASFPAGLVIYWTANNVLSMLQQYVIMRRMGIEVKPFQGLRIPFMGGKKQEGDEAANDSK